MAGLLSDWLSKLDEKLDDWPEDKNTNDNNNSQKRLSRSSPNNTNASNTVDMRSNLQQVMERGVSDISSANDKVMDDTGTSASRVRSHISVSSPSVRPSAASLAPSSEEDSDTNTKAINNSCINPKQQQLMMEDSCNNASKVKEASYVSEPKQSTNIEALSSLKSTSALDYVSDSTTVEVGTLYPAENTSGSNREYAFTEESKISNITPQEDLDENDDADDFCSPNTSPLHHSLSAEFDDMLEDCSDDDEDIDEEGALPFDSPWDFDTNPTINCNGRIHVRLIRAKNLPIIDTSVFAILSLKPWKGKVKTKKVESFLSSPYHHGVPDLNNQGGVGRNSICARWKYEENEIYSFLHPYNNEETPYPELYVELWSSKLMFESVVCRRSIHCGPLMADPGKTIKKWFTLENNEGVKGNNYAVYESERPKLLLEIVFEASIPEPSIQHAVASSEMTGDETYPSTPTTKKESSADSVPGSPLSRKRTISKELNLPFLAPSPHKPHMFRLHSFWTPSWCAVCSALLTGWQIKGYRCETCGLDCCDECQIRADVELPCCSDKALHAVKNSFQQKYSISNLSYMVAPAVVAKDEQTLLKEMQQSSMNEIPDFDDLVDTSSGSNSFVGYFKIKLISAKIFESCSLPEAEVDCIDSQLKSSDYYARISWSGGSDSDYVRTRTAYQTSKPHFEDVVLVFKVAHYGMEFKIDVVDAITDKIVGTTLLSAQGVLQEQRDAFVSSEFSFTALTKPHEYIPKMFKNIKPLRIGIKDGFGLGFYDASSTGNQESKDAKGLVSQAGQISGAIEFDASFEEDKSFFYKLYPKIAPSRPPDDFNVNLIQLHIARAQQLVDDLNNAMENYWYIMNWEDPALTSLCMIIFVFACIHLDSEYYGCVPFFFLLCYTLSKAWSRFVKNSFQNRWIETERKARIKASEKVAISYTLHRPISMLKVLVKEGRNLVSTELGMPGLFYAKVEWVPNYFLDQKRKDILCDYDMSSSDRHLLGITSSNGVTSNPIWERITRSDESQRLQMLLSGAKTDDSDQEKHSKSNDVWADESSFVYPILQPIAPKKFKKITGDGKAANKLKLESWKSSPGAVVISVHNGLNAFFEDIIGEVVLPLSTFVENDNGRGFTRGWMSLKHNQSTNFDNNNKNTENMSAIFENEDVYQHGADSESLDTSTIGEADLEPAIFVECSLAIPQETDNKTYSDVDKEASILIAQEMIHAASIAKNNIGMIGSSINTLKSMSGMGSNLQWIQNFLGSTLDTIEACRNLFTWADPFKSTFVLIFLVFGWYLLCIIPTRFLVLLGGMSQFLMKFIPSEDMSHQNNIEAEESVPFATHFVNFLSSTPTDEDLRRAYFWETRRRGNLERESLEEEKRTSRLKSLWRASWFGTLKLKLLQENQAAIGTSARSWYWKNIFAVLQGHRFVWWSDVRSFDRGDKPLGALLFSGHSGLANLSPLDLRELKIDEQSRTVCLFGRGDEGQVKLVFLTSDVKEKVEIEGAVLDATADVKAQ